MKLEDTAVLFESDWAWNDWILPIAALLAALALVSFARPVSVWIWETIDNAIAGAIVAGVVFVASSLATVGFAYLLMRHSESQVVAVVIGAALIVAAIALLVRGFAAPNKMFQYLDWAASAVIAWAAIAGVVLDALNRAASAIPTSASSLATLLVVGAVIVVVAVRGQR